MHAEGGGVPDPEGPVNLIDYVAYLENQDGIVDHSVRKILAAPHFKTNWWQVLKQDDYFPLNTQEYYEVLTLSKTREHELGTDQPVVPLSFLIDPSLQGIAPFLSAYDLPVGDGFPDSRNLLIAHDGEVVFAPTETEFLDAITYIRDLWQDGLIDDRIAKWQGLSELKVGYFDHAFSITNPYVVDPSDNKRGSIRDDSPIPFFDVMIAWHKGIEATTDPTRVVLPPTDENWTQGVPLRSDPNPKTIDWRQMASNDLGSYTSSFIPRFSDRWSTGEIEEVYLPLIDHLVGQKISEWIVEGDAPSEWSEFQRELDKRGLPYLLDVWQTHLNRMR